MKCLNSNDAIIQISKYLILFLLALSIFFTQTLQASGYKLQDSELMNETYPPVDGPNASNTPNSPYAAIAPKRCFLDRCVDRITATDVYINCSEKADGYIDKYELNWFRNFFQDVLCDYSIYYGEDNLKTLGWVFLGIGIMANTNIDKSIHRFWQKNIRGRDSDRHFERPCAIGKFSYWRIYIGSTFLGYMLKKTPESGLLGDLLYEWGYQSFRILLLVSPQELFFSWALGNGRPSTNCSSRWKPFKYHEDNAGCSGHAFNGAIPFLALSTMTDNLFLKYGLYAVSTLPGLSRINAGKHYFSQFILG